MKKFLLAGAFAVVATTAFAGGLSEPQIEFEVIENAAVASSGSDEWVLILMTVLLFGVALI